MLDVNPDQPWGSNFPTALTTPHVTVPPSWNLILGAAAASAARSSPLTAPRLSPSPRAPRMNSRRLILPSASRPLKSSTSYPQLLLIADLRFLLATILD